MQRQVIGGNFDLALFVIGSMILHLLFPQFCIGYLSDVSKPASMILILAVDTVEKHGLQSGGDRTTFAAADTAIIKFANRRNFRCCAGKKCFIGAIDFVAGDTLFDYGDSDFCGELYDRSTGDAFQTGSHIWRIELAVLDDEYIFARSFRHIAVHIQQ